ncbi:hypothetical protein BCR42DRAFT_403072 [Absidia repens]|uniref:Uncharacterized protein n=1 Tax=Absidia repens TaxID=90262 RepID=A0A1X2IYR6_9FUNG|nr:hypothetical protein BCR42DRAFT_403072 [Absidia repens]
MYHSTLAVLLLLFEVIHAQTLDTPGTAPVSTTGFNPNEDAPVNHNQQSWIQRDHNYIIVIVAVFIVVGLILYYIVRSMRGMRQRLVYENEQQLHMLNQMQPHQPYPPIDERPPAMMDGYKFDQYSQKQQQQPNTHHHRY